ncbi:MAG: hypothetical protein M1527_02005 [Gammaproteobacteria bacterium]|nr:hypothetical protein [Gammaproteobacteria bacterium]
MIEIGVIVLTAIVNGAVMWGVVRTELKYMRRDVDRAHKRLDRLNDQRLIKK